MGAGRGQRRAKTYMSGNVVSLGVVSSLKGIRITYDWDEWCDWLSAASLDRVKLLSYYLGNERMSTNKVVTNKEKEFIIRELFMDAVDVDAIQLPKKMDSKNFSFKIGHTASSSPLHNHLLVEYTPGGNEKPKKKTTCFPAGRIQNHALSDGYHLDNLLYERVVSAYFRKYVILTNLSGDCFVNAVPMVVATTARPALGSLALTGNTTPV